MFKLQVAKIFAAANHPPGTRVPFRSLQSPFCSCKMSLRIRLRNLHQAAKMALQLTLSKGSPEDVRLKKNTPRTSAYPLEPLHFNHGQTRGAKTPSPSACSNRPRASPVRDCMIEPPQPPAMPPSKDGAPPSPPQ
ncbi:hypothetical protein CK203_018373 [Vitis vinifera]|uniref:Uncharacterized protein n=1 Tax=Vitis vinifera TaxID=29760 RepID=A0A438JP32_VITVI|nr:hypothetical protein CK203_018373 [Vitis vinifera]